MSDVTLIKLLSLFPFKLHSFSLFFSLSFSLAIVSEEKQNLNDYINNNKTKMFYRFITVVVSLVLASIDVCMHFLCSFMCVLVLTTKKHLFSMKMSPFKWYIINFQNTLLLFFFCVQVKRSLNWWWWVSVICTFKTDFYLL